MLELYKTPVDILYFVLTIGAGLVALFLVIALYYLIRVLSDVHSVTDKVKDTVDLVNHYLWQPIKIFMTLVEKGKEYAAKRAKKRHQEE